jgi:hypothetical protein
MRTNHYFSKFVNSLVILGLMLSATGTAVYAQGGLPPTPQSPTVGLGPTDPPSTPPNFRVSGSTPTSVTLAWDDVLYETGYNIYRFDNVSSFVYAGSVSANVTTFTETKASCGWTEYYEVSAFNAYGESSHAAWVSASTQACPPEAPALSLPANGSSNPSTYNLVFQWASSLGATEYLLEWWGGPYSAMQPCGWSSATSCAIGQVPPDNTYSWHVKARNSDLSESDWSPTWTFTILPVPPGVFIKETPTNGAAGQSTSPTLTWGTSSDATSYEYCYDTTNDNLCTTWISTDITDATLSGLANGTTYYWQVRAVNAGGTTYANGASPAFWSFTTSVTPPAAFGKSSPVSGATNQSTSPTLTWGASSGATSYEYCYDNTNDNSCSAWTNNGLSTSKSLSGLSGNTTYYWHVRAVNSGGTTYADGTGTAFWSFTTMPVPPAAFGKSSPVNGATGQSDSPTLMWNASAGATSYEYCYDTTNDNLCLPWTSNSLSTSRSLIGLSPNTTYYWQVRAVNADGTTYADGASMAFWSFTTLPNPPTAFGKTSPTDGDITQSTSPILMWSASTGATNYEYCYDTTNDNACSSWTSNGTATSRALSGLSANTTYYWHVRAVNSGGTTYADVTSIAFWSFTTMPNPPAAFGKTIPIDGAINQSTSPTLMWSASTGAANYEYCYDTTNDNACSSWTSNGTATSRALSGLSANTTYYWHVRAVNAGGTTYADSTSFAFWSFTTMPVPPAAFGKSSPLDGDITQSTSPVLMWGASSGATSYEYCYDTTNDNLCFAWTSNGTATSRALSGLSANTTYYWHVRAINAAGTTYADGTSITFWSFTTLPNPPTAFGKFNPSNGATNQTTSPTLTWSASTGAASYDYCYDTTNDNACSSWTSNGTATSKVLNGLANDTTYYWHVRAINTGGITYADSSSFAFWSFTTTTNPPAAFGKSSPINGATNQSASTTLTWGTSAGAASYEYCYDTSNDNACSSWTSNGTATSKSLSGLAYLTTYYWHVRAVNTGGTTYADSASTAFWSFTTMASPPPTFGKTSPVNGATNQSLSPTLFWGTSIGATSYETCYDTTNDNFCSTWTSNGLSTSRALSGLINGVTYYWQVRAINTSGTTYYADGASTAFWAFTTSVNPPAAFWKTSPANGATNQSASPTLTWNASAGATSYEYCYDTTNDNACSAWTSNGASTSIPLSGLGNGTTYYWHVRAINVYGTTYADGASTAFWSFTTSANPPGAFGKASPTDGATNQSTSPTLSWGLSSGATSYEYCYDTTNNSACSVWTSNGASTSVPLSGLANGTTYYWHVRAVNVNGTTYADGTSTAFWSFTTSINPPAAFGKADPINGAVGQSTSPTLTWNASTGADSYEYCYDTTNDNYCSAWVGNGTSISVSLSGLSTNTTYYWQVRAINTVGTTYADGANTAFWLFTTASSNPPAAFGKADPINGAVGQSTSPTLTWNASTGADSYEYCYDTTNDNFCSTWIGNGTATSIALSGLFNNTTYYWHVRAINLVGTTYADGATTAFWLFTTSANPPGAFGKTNPADGATNQSTSPTLSWSLSSGASSYEYCYDAIDDSACSAWTNNGASTSKSLSGLATDTTYYWQVRAVNADGTTYADDASTAFWSFTTSSTISILIAPANGEQLLHLRPVFDWIDIPGITSYTLQVSTNSSFATQVQNVTVSSSTYATTSDLASNTRYYWRVKYRFPATTTILYSEVFTFTTGSPPSVPVLLSPANLALVTTTRPLFDWGDSTLPAGAAFDHYQIQILTGNTIVHDRNITGISNSRDNTAQLKYGTLYVWRVRSWSAAGHYSSWSEMRSIRIAYAGPILLRPANKVTGVALKPTFTWTAIAGAASYTIQVSRYATFSLVAVNSTVANRTFTLTTSLNAHTTYYWRVRANGPYGPGAWSVIFKFTTR